MNYLFLLLAFARAVAGLVLRARSTRTVSRPHCPKCGYDMTGHAGRRLLCPECGSTRHIALRQTRIQSLALHALGRVLLFGGVAASLFTLWIIQLMVGVVECQG